MGSTEEFEFWKTIFCPKMELEPKGTLIATVQRNRTGDCFSRIIDFDHGVFQPVYPVDDMNSAYTQRRFGELLVCYRGGLSSAPLESLKAILPIHETNTHPPFCCSQVKSFKPCVTSFDAVFSNLLAGNQGHHPNVILEVIRQVNNGPKISTTYWTLKNNSLEELPPFSEQQFQKKGVFKNYTCSTHDLFFGVNLLALGAVQNKHHMRLYNFARDNPKLLKEFHEAVETQTPQFGLM